MRRAAEIEEGMRKAAVIGASAESLHSIREAQKLGIEVIALDGNPAAEGLSAADKGLHVDISDETAVLRALEGEGIDFVLTVPIGRYLSTVGAVNDALGLKGVSREAAVLCTDKYRFHQRLAGQGLRDCHCYLVEPEAAAGQGSAAGRLEGESAPGQERPLSYPAILKPRYGSGSRGIFFLQGKEQLEQALSLIEGDDEDYVLEEAVSGTEYGVDGAVEGDRFRLILLRKKLLTPPPARQAVGYLSVLPEREAALSEGVERYLAQIVKALGLQDCLLHADLMIEGDRPFVIELSARPSGHNLHNLFTPLATGIDMAREFIRYQTGLPCRFVPEKVKPMLIRYFDFEDCVIERVPARETISLPEGVRLVCWQCGLRPGDRMEKVTTGHSIMGRGYFILEGEAQADLTAGAQAVLAQFGTRAQG